jgi:hypothetical protein
MGRWRHDAVVPDPGLANRVTRARIALLPRLPLVRAVALGWLPPALV